MKIKKISFIPNFYPENSFKITLKRASKLVRVHHTNLLTTIDFDFKADSRQSKSIPLTDFYHIY